MSAPKSCKHCGKRLRKWRGVWLSQIVIEGRLHEDDTCEVKGFLGHEPDVPAKTTLEERRYVCFTCGNRGTVGDGFTRNELGLRCECESANVRWDKPEQMTCAACLRPLWQRNGRWHSRRSKANHNTELCPGTPMMSGYHVPSQLKAQLW